MNLEDPGVLIGALTILLGLFSLANSFSMAWIERRIERRARASDLYNDYYSADNYRRVVWPISRIALKWNALPEPEKSAYRKAVRKGWLIEETADGDLLKAVVSAEELRSDADCAHFRDTQSSEAFTEHEALTVFLYFWTKVYEMMRTGVIDRKVAKRLLKRPYGYTRGFVRALRDDIKAHVKKGHEPIWFEATLALEKMFD